MPIVHVKSTQRLYKAPAPINYPSKTGWISAQDILAACKSSNIEPKLKNDLLDAVIVIPELWKDDYVFEILTRLFAGRNRIHFRNGSNWVNRAELFGFKLAMGAAISNAERRGYDELYFIVDCSLVPPDIVRVLPSV